MTKIPGLQIHPESAKEWASSLYLETFVCGMLLASLQGLINRSAGTIPHFSTVEILFSEPQLIEALSYLKDEYLLRVMTSAHKYR